jgi:hypothetical protein
LLMRRFGADLGAEARVRVLKVAAVP